MANVMQPLERRTFEAQRLFEEHPPVIHDRNKRAVFEIACPEDARHAGQVVFTRWRAMPLPEEIAAEAAAARVARHDGFYDYAPALPEAVEWHVNFADPHLFFAYGGGLFAQDEMQVAEHPVLGALKEALDAGEGTPLTVDGKGPTPVLVAGAERRCRVATDRNPAEGRPHGLYGNEFARAREEAVRRATTRIDPPTVTNVIAIAAPGYGSGAYAAREIEQVLVTAFTGFRAAVLESVAGPVAVHSGFWGCGAFGGNRVLMTLLQVVAAGAAGADRLVLHLPGKGGADALAAALDVIRTDLAGPAIATRDLVRKLSARGFRWGVSDGN
jgi:hypothetical protein